MKTMQSRTLTLGIIGTALLACGSASIARGQSTDRRKPTPLTTRDLIARADFPLPKAGWARTFYFTLEAGPGDLKVTVLSWSGELTSPRWDDLPASQQKDPATTPGRPAGGWHESRFGNGVFYNVQLVGETIRTEPTTVSEKTTTHPHGPRSVPLGSLGLIAPQERGRREVTKTFRLPERARLIMIVNLSGRFNYRIKFDGPIVIADPR